MSLARFSWRQVWKGALIWAVVVAIVVATGVETFKSGYKTAAARHAFALSIGRLPAFQALYGRAVRVDTVGGFISWRYGDIMTLILGLWALLAVTRILRGDEETLRAEVLVAGRLSPRRLMLAELGMVAVGCALVMAVVALAAIASGLPAGGSVLFGFMVASGGIIFGAMAAFTSQLFETRRRAAGWAGVALGASYLLRALADGSTRLHGLGWVTPLGLTERIDPFAGPSAGPIALVVATSAIFLALAVYLREKRDTGAGILGAHVGASGSRVVRSAFRLDWSLSTGALTAWACGVFAELFVLGYLTRDMVRFASDNPSIDDMISKIYGYSIGSAVGFLSLAFSVVALMLAVYAGTHMISAREEETSGRADTLVVAGTSRMQWLAARITVALGAMVGLALIAAVGAWAGATVSGEPISIADAVKASFNVIPAALLFGGLTVLAFGAVPRATAYVAFGAATAAFLVQVLAGLSGAPSWLIDLSPFSHIAPVPASSMNTTATLVMLAVAAASTALGLLAFQRRDLAPD